MESAPSGKSSFKPKKTMTSLDLMAWLEENRELLISSRINNVYRIEGSSKVFMLKMHTKLGTKFLILEPAVRIHFTDYKIPTPPQPDGLTMSIRRHIRGSIIRKVEQIGFDRLLKIGLSNGNQVIVELLPRGVLAVINNEGKLLVASEYKEMRDRIIKPGKPYSLPPYISNSPTLEKCEEGVENSVKNLIKTLGVPNEVVNEALHRASGSRERFCSELLNIIYEARKHRGYLVNKIETGEPFFFAPYKPTFITSIGQADALYSIYEKDSFNEVVDTFFSFGLAKRLGEEKAKEEAGKKGRLESRLEKEQKLIEEYEIKSQQYYQVANMLMANRYVLEKILNCVNEVRRRAGWEKVSSECKGVKKTEPSAGRVVIELGSGEVIELLVNKHVKDQIAEYFEKAKKLKKKAESAKKHLEELKIKLEKQAKQAKEVSQMIVKTVRKKEWYETFWWSITRNGLLVIAGRDASQNEALVRKHLGPTDIFLHADIHGAPATILKVPANENPLDEDINDAALIAASYSKAWKEGLAAIDVFWVYSNQVSKSPPSGEYLPKGSFMIYGKKNFVRKVNLTLSVGVQEWGNGLRFIVGSEEAVSRNGILLAIVMPGEVDKEKIAKKITEKAWSKGVQTPHPTELASLLPGRSRIIKIL